MKAKRFLAAGSAIALCATPAMAQTTTPAGADSQTQGSNPVVESAVSEGDIIVTANRTESLASRTPVSLTAISGEGLRTAGITNPTALADQVPGISVDRNNGGLQVTIRGITSSDQTEKGDPSAAFLLDGVYIARPQAQEVSFFDIARVEVLRGPQGTLYGRNTTAGLINVITNRPTFTLGGSVDLGVGNYGARQATGVVNVPLSDNLAVRASVNYDRRDNYVDAGPRMTGSIDPFKNNVSGRVQALYNWSSGDLLISGDYADIRGNTQDYLPLSNFYSPDVAQVNPAYIGGSGDRFRTANAAVAWDATRRNRSWGIGGQLTQDLGPVTLTYIGSYREFDRNEQDGRFSADQSQAYRFVTDGHFAQNSQELRFASNGDGPLKFQLGGNYFRESGNQALRILFVPNPGPTGDGFTIGFLQHRVVSESYAFFGQGTYALTDRFRLTGGLRYTHDNKSRIGDSVVCGTLACASPTVTGSNDADRNFSRTTWRAGAEYDLTPKTLLYATVSTGYKAGGFNDGCQIGTGTSCTLSAAVLYYQPETLTAYEGGIKTRFLDNAVRLNLAGFHYDYKNIQLSQVLPDCGSGAPCGNTTNAGKASVSGAEAEGVMTPSHNDRFDFSVAYLDAHYTQFSPTATISFAGRKLDRSPTWTVTAGYQHTFPLQNGGGVVAGVRTRMSDSYQLINLPSYNFYRQPSFTKTDATLTYNAPDNRWYLQGFVKNIEDANVVTTVVVGIVSSVQISDPRTYGVRAGFRF